MEDMLLHWICQKKLSLLIWRRGVVYEFTFDQHKVPLSKKATEYLQKEKEIEMATVYQFELKLLELLDVGSGESSEIEE